MRILLLALGLLFTPLASADDAARHPSDTPRAELAKLAPLLGTWIQTMSSTSDGGETWQTSAPETVSLVMRNKGLLVAETPHDTSGPGFNIETYFTYDQYRQVFRMAAMDDVWGLMDVYEGVMSDDGLTVTNLRSQTGFPTEQGLKLFRLQFQMPEGNERWVIIDGTFDGGDSWEPAFKIHLVRADNAQAG